MVGQSNIDGPSGTLRNLGSPYTTLHHYCVSTFEGIKSVQKTFDFKKLLGSSMHEKKVLLDQVTCRRAKPRFSI